jgi:hypothetical protein
MGVEMVNKTSDTRLTKVIDEAAQTVSITASGFPTIVIDAKHLAETVRTRAMLFGLSETVGNAAAVEYRQPDGTSRKPTWKQKYDLMVARYATLQSGVWKSARESDDASLLVEALQMVSGETRENVETLLRDSSEAEILEMRRDPLIGYRILEIRRNRQFAAAKDAEPSAALAGIMAKLQKKSK